MAQWKYQITIFNALDRKLHLNEANIPWGRKGHDFPETIEPFQEITYSVISPNGSASGIEFYFIFSDECPEKKEKYGTIQISAHIPYWQNRNTSSCCATGRLVVEGFRQIPNDVHDFDTRIIVRVK